MAHIHRDYDFTVSAFILHPTDKKILLHYHKKLCSWLQPGGHIELDEDPEIALWREVQEETGLKKSELQLLAQTDQPNPSIKILPIPFHFNVHEYDNSHKHIDLCYLLRSKSVTLHPKVGESSQIEWLAHKQIVKLNKNGSLFDNTLEICNWIFNKYM